MARSTAADKKVVLLIGNNPQGGLEHRFVAEQFQQHFGNRLAAIIVPQAQTQPNFVKLRRAIKKYSLRGWVNRILRLIYAKVFQDNQKSALQIESVLFPQGRSRPLTNLKNVVEVSSHNGKDTLALLESLDPDIIAVYGTKIIRQGVIDRAKLGILNMHTGLSPYYRGDSTTFWPLVEGRPEYVGVTIHDLVAHVDGGGIYRTNRPKIDANDTEHTLFAKSVQIGTKDYIRVIEEKLAGNATSTPQDLKIGKEFRNQQRTVWHELKLRWRLSRGLLNQYH